MPKLASKIDPTFEGGVLDADRIIETADAKVMSASERQKLDTIASPSDLDDRFRVRDRLGFSFFEVTPEDLKHHVITSMKTAQTATDISLTVVRDAFQPGPLDDRFRVRDAAGRVFLVASPQELKHRTITLMKSAQVATEGILAEVSSAFKPQTIDDRLRAKDASGRTFLEVTPRDLKHRTITNLTAADAALASRAAALEAAISAISDSGPRRAVALADINHVQGSGQSLMVGVTSSPGLTTVTTAGCYKPSNGEHDSANADEQGITGPPTSTGFAPLTYSLNQETVGVGGVSSVKKWLNDRLGANSHEMLWSNNARGAQPIANLKKGTNYYAWGQAQAALYQQLAAAQGKSYVQTAVWWMQGEGDASAANSEIGYTGDIKQYIDDWNGDLPQAHRVPLLTYQMASHTVRNGGVLPNIALAQLRASIEHDDIYLVCPMYFVPYSPDNVHLPSHSERWIGQYFAKVQDIVCHQGREWSPLRPTAVKKQGKLVDVFFHVPSGPLVIDTANVAAVANYGFTAVKSSDGSAVAISSVTLKAEDGRVRIVLASDPGEPVVIRYAWGANGQATGPTYGARGNLRDSDATVSPYLNASGVPYPLWNWCVIFAETSTNW